MSASFVAPRYTPTSQVTHWLSALLVCLAWILGLFGDEFPKGVLRETANFIHISAGEIIAFLLILRLILRFFIKHPTKVPSWLGRWAGHAATLMHLALYLLLGAVIIAGVMTEFSGEKALPLFGLYEIASPWVKDRDFRHFIKELHELFANSLMALVLIHSVAALAHHYILRDNTLKGMLPGILSKG